MNLGWGAFQVSGEEEGGDERVETVMFDPMFGAKYLKGVIIATNLPS